VQTSLRRRASRNRPLSEREAAATRAATLLNEILEYQTRLNRLTKLCSSADEHYLINAYKHQLQRRRAQLAALPQPPEAAPNPWR
jgi:hypothetical protein